jgi:type I restriction enzyme S subunit
MAVWSSVEVIDLSEDFRLDAEHYQPEYLAQERATTKRRSVELYTVADVSDGNHLSIAEEFSESGVRYVRGQDLSDFFISDADPIYIPEKIYRTLTRSHMLAGDVLVGIVGTIGSVGLVTKRHGNLTGNCKLAIIRAHALPAEYIAAYLTSRIGQNEIHRRIRGAVQMGLILPDLKTLPIVVPTDKEREKIVNLVKDAEASRERSRELIQDAENLLTDSVGLSTIDFSESLSYQRQFADLSAARRFGAEYFMPCKQRVLDALAQKSRGPLSMYYTSQRDLFDPTGAKRGDLVRNFDLTDALNPVLDNRLPPVPAHEIGSTKKKLKTGDVVISRLRAYLREIAHVRTTDTIPTVGSSEFIVLRRRETEKHSLSRETLLVFLRSLPVQTILKWSQDGSQHPRFNEDGLLAIPVPTAVENISLQVDKLVNKALAAQADASKLLTEATAKVEDLVLKGAK